MILLIYGPQGSGKSTQAKLLAEKLGVINVSAGQISRQIATENTVEGRVVKEKIDSGNPTPDEILNPRLEKIWNSPMAAKGFILDGFPRFGQQLEFLNHYLVKTGRQVDKVIVIELSLEEGIRRIATRVKTEGRDDDTPEGVTRRLELYKQQTLPIIDSFSKQGKVVEVEGSGSIEEVHKDIVRKLNL